MDQTKLFQRAAQIRRRGRAVKPDEYLNFNGHGDNNHICTLINSEEILLCAGIEKKLGTWTGRARDQDIAVRIQKLLTGEWPKVVVDS